MKNILFAIGTLLLISSCARVNQNKITENRSSKKDSLTIKKIFNSSLTQGKSYSWLHDLTKNIGGRLSGSSQAEQAVNWGKSIMESIALDSVWLQPVQVPHWVRGEKEEAFFSMNNTKIKVPICALGGSIATPKNGISAEVIEVKSLKEAEARGNELKDKIVFFNRPFNDTLINTFEAYGGCVDQRVYGAKTVGKFGAKAVIVRSMTSYLDNYPHTGNMHYGEIADEEKIPAAAISTLAAEKLNKALIINPHLKFYFKQNCKTLPDANSFNVIGEIKGTVYPDKIITIGGHLDSWDLAEGAQDDGAGIVQSLEVAHLFKILNIKPKHTIRIVFFMNEENGLRGGKKYAEQAILNNENHIAAIESDAGGFTPRGFIFLAKEDKINLFKSWKKLLSPYGLNKFTKGHAGADISPLKSKGLSKIGYSPDSQRYFKYHHSALDTFEVVNKRELELGAASIASFTYLIDQYLN